MKQMAKRVAHQKLSKATALALAQKYLDRHQPRGYRMVAQANKTEYIDGHWYIQVDPVPEDANTADSSRRMIKAMMELQEAEEVPVELTSMLPRDILAAEMLFPRIAQAMTAVNGHRRKRKSA
jgi:hypothetical protein